MTNSMEVEARIVRHFKIQTGCPFEEFRARYETAVPHFDRLKPIGVVLSGSGWGRHSASLRGNGCEWLRRLLYLRSESGHEAQRKPASSCSMSAAG